MTPRGTPWVSPESGKTYYMEFQVDLPSFNAAITVTSLMDSQEFVSKLGPFLISEVYEGVASASGTFMGQDVTGTAWNEQAPA
jgi:Lipocalin-like domain